MVRSSPLVGALDDLATRAWALSTNDMAWAAPIGEAIVSVFEAALREKADEPSGAPGARIVTDARDCGGNEAFVERDDAILTAFTARRSEYDRSRGKDLSKAEEDTYFANIDAQEAVLRTTRATTLEGVVAKLRVAFLHQAGDLWSDLSISDTSSPEFQEGLAAADPFTRLAWNAIEDLARIGGVTLSEQGK